MPALVLGEKIPDVHHQGVGGHNVDSIGKVLASNVCSCPRQLGARRGSKQSRDHIRQDQRGFHDVGNSPSPGMFQYLLVASRVWYSRTRSDSGGVYVGFVISHGFCRGVIYGTPARVLAGPVVWSCQRNRHRLNRVFLAHGS